MLFARGMPVLLAPWLGNTASAEFVDGKPDFFDGSLPSPLAYYYFDDGSGYDLKESVSADPAGGTVLFVEDHQVDSVHTEPNWVDDDEYFGTTIACGEISGGSLQKDTLSLKDVDYGSTGAWAWSVWFRHEEGVNFPNYQREQFFGHGDPEQPTSAINQVHVQYEKDGTIRSIVNDSQDADKPNFVTVQNTEDLSTDDGAWHHLVLTTREDGFKGFNVYVDGELKASSPRGQGGNADPGASGVWLAAGGDPIDPVGPIRFCGREQSAGFNENRYFRGRVAHFSVWDAALSPFEVSALYFSYANRYGLSRPEASDPAPSDNAPSDPEPSDPEPSPPSAAEPCDICEGEPVANPLTVIDISGFPPESCGKAGATISNNVASQFGATPQAACAHAKPLVKEICCVAADGFRAPPEVSAPAAAPAPGATETEEIPTAGATADADPAASGGLSPGAVAGVAIGSVALVALIAAGVFAVRKNGRSSSSAEYDTNAPAIKAAIADQKELEKAQDSDTEHGSNGASKDGVAPV